ncbi:MAG TPA: hypothetical protein VHS99_19465, partial [Chloroflexota bacterium]|nr:hypothetical protein [Chloroflexota bacterium]
MTDARTLAPQPPLARHGRRRPAPLSRHAFLRRTAALAAGAAAAAWTGAPATARKAMAPEAGPASPARPALPDTAPGQSTAEHLAAPLQSPLTEQWLRL